MKHKSPTLSQQFPGPYEVHRGVCGTEETYEVVSSSDDTVAWTFFWDAAIWCEMRATAVAFALNQKYSPKTEWPKDIGFVQIFFRLFPGPFAQRKVEDCFFTEREVYCQTTGHHIVGIDKTESLANHVAKALNKASQLTAFTNRELA